jgi:hypothetical protein
MTCKSVFMFQYFAYAKFFFFLGVLTCVCFTCLKAHLCTGSSFFFFLCHIGEVTSRCWELRETQSPLRWSSVWCWHLMDLLPVFVEHTEARWSSGPRRHVQVVISPGGVGSNPTLVTVFLFTTANPRHTRTRPR